jgi:hypothetical protein
MGAPRVTAEDAQQRIRAIFGDIVTLKVETFVRVDKKALFVDIKYGEWWALPSNVFKGHGHPKRGACITSRKIKIRRGLTLAKLQERLNKFELGLTFVHETFTGSNTKCCFIDPVYGMWWATPSNVIHRRTKHPERAKLDRARTMFARYGVDNPTKNQIIALKAARKSNKVMMLSHWKSSEQLVCVGSYEIAVVKWFNTNQYDYEWQPGPFEMPDGRTYRPDVLILTGAFTNVYVEVKGYFRGDANEKWEWFHTQNPKNSQLWDKQRLIELGILTKKRTKLSLE